MALSFVSPGTYVLGGISAPTRGTGQAFRAGLTTAQQRREREQAMDLRASAEARAQEQFEMAKADRARAVAAAAESKRRQDELNRLLAETAGLGLERTSAIALPTAPTTGTPGVATQPATAPTFTGPGADLSFGTTVTPAPTTPYSGRPTVPGQMPAAGLTIPGAGDTTLAGGPGADTLATPATSYGSLDELYNAFVAGEITFPEYSRQRIDLVRAGQAALTPEQGRRQEAIDLRTERAAEAAALGQELRTAAGVVIDRPLGVVSAAGSALYGMAADILGAGAATTGLIDLAVDLEQLSDQAYNIARTNLRGGLSATVGMTPEQFDMDPAEFAAIMKQAEEDAERTSVITDEAPEDEPTVDDPVADVTYTTRSPSSPTRFTFDMVSNPPRLSQRLQESYAMREQLVDAYTKFAERGFWDQASLFRDRIAKLDETLIFMEGQQAVNDAMLYGNGQRLGALFSYYMGGNIAVVPQQDGTFSLTVDGRPHPDTRLVNMDAAELESAARAYFDAAYQDRMAGIAQIREEAQAEAFGKTAGELAAQQAAAERAAAQARAQGLPVPTKWTLVNTSQDANGNPQYFIQTEAGDIRILQAVQDPDTNEYVYVITAYQGPDVTAGLVVPRQQGE